MVSPAGRNAATADPPEEPAPAVGVPVETPPRVDGGSADPEARTEAELALAARPRLLDEETYRRLPTAQAQDDDDEDPDVDDAVVSLGLKDALLSMALSIVSVTSTAPDGSKTVRCSGIVVGVCSDGAGKHARILTASAAVCTSQGVLQDPKPKLSVRLPDGTDFEGQLLFFNDHYGLALLDITVDIEPPVASFGVSPEYGQEVFVLARGESVMARHGTILLLEEPFLGRNHNMFLSCKIPEWGTGGAVIDHDGRVTGMAFFHSPNPAIITTSTILICIEMWTQYSCIARPVLGMHLRAVDLLDLSLREQLSICHDINKGFIVDQVIIDSAAERLGIRQGNVIVFREMCGSTLPELEDFLLFRGWEYLQRNIDSCLMVDFKLDVHDLLGRARRNITLTVGLSDSSELVENNWCKLDSPRQVSTLSDPDSAAALHSLQDRDMVLTAVRSVVGVSSTRPDTNNVFQCTGIVIAITSNEAGKHARILTSSSIFCSDEGNLHHPEQKVFVHLPNKTILEGHLSFLNTHYQIALLDISTDYPLRSASFGQMPQYGQKVFLLGRDKECSVIVRRELISTLEQSSSGRNHYMFLTCECGAPMDFFGGPVIDTYGNMMGVIIAHYPKVAIISSTTVKTCIDMWEKFRCIARPMIDMDLRAVGLLGIGQHDKLSCQYNIERGFVVDMVRYGSAAEKNGIRKGRVDVIEIIDEECGSTLPQLEDYLLTLGWRFLHQGFDPRSTTDLMIRVHDLLQRTSRDVQLPLPYALS
ncbi:uncharacterized protein [Lolium perenne]|uniref:uncharacterized protein isoform X2 n=1 Tax=Lolium perenne TaxID=4522 RepID=UPI0021F5A706|nr:uncharacterized protein LOC127297396 isoform X2 [Lolium perenne]